MELSNEQIRIVEEINSGNNVQVNAVPGSGKTTTILGIAENTRKRILCLTFSRRLKEESEKRLTVRNCMFQTVHGASKYFYGKFLSDMGMWEIKKTPNFEILILDESQDFGFEHYRFVKKLISDNQNEVQIVILGDLNQTIFDQYAKVMSDSRFLSFAYRIYGQNNEWKFMPLTQSFRLTIENANFINKVILKTDKIYSTKQGVKPRLIVTNSTERNIDIINELYYYLELGYNISDIFLLMPTIVKYQQNIELINRISSMGILVYHCDKDMKYSVDCSNGKLNFLTYHSSKGLENKVVIILGFDESYYNCFRNDTTRTCPNILYVGFTRMTERLTLIKDCDRIFLPFIDKSKIRTYCDIVKGNLIEGIRREIVPNPRDIYVKDLLEAVKPTTIKEIIEMLTLEIKERSGTRINLEEKIYIAETNTYEYVADISGIAIISYFEMQATGKMSINKGLPLENFTIENTISKSISFNSSLTGMQYRKTQITRRDWISQRKMDECIERLEFFKTDSQFETVANRFHLSQHGMYNIIGVIDYINERKNILAEFKCKTEIAYEDIIQALLYTYISYKKYKTYLFNVITDQLIRIKFEYGKLEIIVNKIIDDLNLKTCIDDDEFINECLNY